VIREGSVERISGGLMRRCDEASYVCWSDYPFRVEGLMPFIARSFRK
jgi:hypothetical protein